jgi:hypothetical protein
MASKKGNTDSGEGWGLQTNPENPSEALFTVV